MSETASITLSTVNPAFSLASSRDTRSLFVPAYALRKREQIPSFVDSLKQQNFGGKNYSESILDRASGRYVFDADDCFDLGELMAGGAAIGRPQWKHRWNANTDHPEGMYNVALLVEGVRSYRSYSLPRGNKNKWLYRMHTASRQCGVAWTKKDGADFEPNSALLPLQVSVRRSAAGAVYCRTERYDDEGKVCGMTVRIILLEVGFRDSRPDKDQVFTHSIVAARVAYSHSAGQFNEPDFSDLEPLWQKVIARARRIFDTFGQVRDEQAWLWTTNFLEQKRAWHSARSERGGFYDQIKAVDWQEALELVRQPWQLKAVVNIHCNARFDESVHRSDTNGSRVAHMLSQHDCSAERKAELQAMVANFVEPMDTLWSYSGD